MRYSARIKYQREMKQDKVNTADSAFIFFLMILLISQNQGGEDGLVWSSQKESQDDFDSECI